MVRRFSSFGTADIERRAQTHPEDLPELVQELEQHRKSKAAKTLLERLRSAGTNPHLPPKPLQLDLRLPEPQASPSAEKIARDRPNNWATMFNYEATAEQEKAVELFIGGTSMKISAFAGAGKTSTLRFLAATAQEERGLYLAFNKAIADEAKLIFPTRTDCRTTHSAALNAVRTRYAFSREKWFDGLNSRQLVSAWGLERYDLGVTALQPDLVAFLILSTVRRFAQSADPAISTKHVILAGRALGLSEEKSDELKAYLLNQAVRLWSEQTSEKSDIPLGHDGYLKLWSLMDPQLAYDFILLDEAQDTNPAVLSVIRNQTCQRIYVGDRHQQIYEWRGAENAMASITHLPEAHLTTSFRFGAAIAEEASRILRALGESLPIQGNQRVRSEVASIGDARAVLTRTNAGLFREVMGSLESGKRPHVVGGTDEMVELLRDVDKLQSGEPGAHPDFFGFTNWREVEEYVREPEGAYLLAFVSLVNQMGRSALWRAVLSAEQSEDAADVVISTAHKAKGREWTSVRISEDFSATKAETERVPRAEARLFYVAMTRAQDRLVVDPVLVTAFASGLEPEESYSSADSDCPTSGDQSQKVSDESASPKAEPDLIARNNAAQSGRKRFLGLF